MYDGLPNLTLPDLLDEVRCFFCDHRRDLSDAARLIAGVSGEGRVIGLSLRLERAVALDDGIRRDLGAVHALLALEHVQEGDLVEAFLLSGPGPATRKVETICLLTDHLDDLLSRIDTVLAETADQDDDHQASTIAWAAA